MHDKQQGCVLVVDNEDFLEGIVTVGDIRRRGFESSEDANSIGENSSVLDVCVTSQICGVQLKLPSDCHFLNSNTHIYLKCLFR